MGHLPVENIPGVESYLAREAARWLASSSDFMDEVMRRVRTLDPQTIDVQITITHSSAIGDWVLDDSMMDVAAGLLKREKFLAFLLRPSTVSELFNSDAFRFELYLRVGGAVLQTDWWESNRSAVHEAVVNNRAMKAVMDS